MTRLTPRQALRDAYASGWATDALAKDTAVAALILDKWKPGDAREAVEAAFAAHFQVMTGG